ncbi:MAG: beta-N-acetylhexosaminidase [Planctomycetaceae bacterium]|jgi:hypothetical protein|nr:beta-N-acetylhexosaminidase [Planctomycetaceae bacterium]
MQRFIFTVLLFAVPFGLCFAAPLSPAEQAAFKKRLLPQPQKIEFTGNADVVLDSTLTVNIELGVGDSSAAQKVKTLFKQFFGTEPKIVVAKTDGVPAASEAYRISATGKTLTLSAADFAGIRYALYSIRQLAEYNHDSEHLTAYFLPEVKITDAPAMKFRGIHICWFPESRAARIEQAIRLAAYYKMNYAVLECWGTFPSVKHPEIGWEGKKAKIEDIRRLVKTGKELGITLIPQFNLFGHASGSRGGSLKHTPLDRHPELLPLYEPDGWTWCISNPATKTVIADIVLEMYEAFDKPPFFHVGFDEAGAPECRRCLRTDYTQLLKEHLLYFHKLLAQQNCRIMMWHDMLLDTADPRWNGYTVCGNKKTAAILDELPKDIVICDWQYGTGKEKDETWATQRYFKEKEFTVLACPYEDTSGMRSQGRNIVDAKLDGMLCTSWHHLYGQNFYKIFSMGAQVMWHAPPDYPGVWSEVFGRHLRQIGWDIPITDYRDSGWLDWQLPPEPAQ